MLANWVNLLPLFIVKRLARKHGQFVLVGKDRYNCATRGVLIKWEPKE